VQLVLVEQSPCLLELVTVAMAAQLQLPLVKALLRLLRVVQLQSPLVQELVLRLPLAVRLSC
jgi:hypothetical protein